MKFKQQTIIVLAGVLLFLNQTTLATASTGSSATSNTAVAIKARSATGLDTAAFSAALQAKLTAKLAAATDQVAVNFVARTAASATTLADTDTATARPLYLQQAGQHIFWLQVAARGESLIALVVVSCISLRYLNYLWQQNLPVDPATSK